MKPLKGKYAAIIALLLGLVSFGFLIASAIVGKAAPYDPTVPPVVTPEHGCFMYSLIISIVSVIPFVVEGVCSIVRATHGKNILLNFLSALLTFGMIPMAFMTSAAWFCYYGVVFAAEVVFLILYCKDQFIYPS